jgi:hypothetical protein
MRRPGGLIADARRASETLERYRETAMLEGALTYVESIPCASRAHEPGTPTHPADWHARCPAGGTIAVCHARRVAVETWGFVICNLGTCKDVAHPTESIGWTRI